MAIGKRARRRRARFQPHGFHSTTRNRAKGQVKMSKSIYFGGSRSLVAGSPASFTLAHVTHAALLAGHKIHVGCATGADQQVISYVMQAYSGQFIGSLSVFAAFGPAGTFSGFGQSGLKFPITKGFFSASAVEQVIAAFNAGVSVSWWAGGGEQVPLSARLIRRSVAGLVGTSAAVFFSPGAGSLAVASHAVSASIPVYAFSSSIPATPAGCAGQWVASSFAGFSCWQWSPAQLSLF